MNQPGGNVTGVTLLTTDIGSKRLGLLHELVPTAVIVALLHNPKNPDAERHLQDVQSAARSLGLQIRVLHASNEGEIDGTPFVALARERPGPLLVSTDPFLTSRREQIVTLANRYKLPALYDRREFADSGGLVSYRSKPHRGLPTDRNLCRSYPKGTNPAELPVIQSAKFELVINLKTAKALGLEVPPTLLARADEVIE